MSDDQEKSKILPGEPVMSDHEYDGISELDNPLPGWWLTSFYMTMVFALGYFMYYSMGPGQSPTEIFEKSMAELNAKKPATGGSQGPTESELNAAIADSGLRQKGKAVYDAKCVSCHGAQGQGGIGTNLTDSFWIHGGKPVQVAMTIQEGILDKGMPPWKAILNPDEVKGLVSYIRSMQGTHPPGAKAPQGIEEK